MANDFEFAKAYQATLDGIIKIGSCSAGLENNNGFYKAGLNANSVSIQELTMSGLGNYSRSTGYKSGDIELNWVEYTLDIDRGRRFMIDTMDLLEAQESVMRIMSEFTRIHVIPEIC